jgi:hypothetical protein
MGGGNQGQVLKYSVVVVAALQATSKEMSPDVPRTKRDYNNKKQHTHTHIPSSQLLEQNLYQNYAVSSSCCCFLFLIAKFLNSACLLVRKQNLVRCLFTK